MVVNGPKNWSLAATLRPEIAAAYDAALDKVTTEIIGWLADHATNGVGPRGRQVPVPVEKLKAAVVRHYTSRAGDSHLHLQINARVFAAGGPAADHRRRNVVPLHVSAYASITRSTQRPHLPRPARAVAWLT